MKKKYENPFIMKLDIDNNTPILSSGKCEENELNKATGNKSKQGILNPGCWLVTIAYADDDEPWTFI